MLTLLVFEYNLLTALSCLNFESSYSVYIDVNLKDKPQYDLANTPI